MDETQPLYFLNNCFVFQDGHREYFDKTKEYTIMPSKEKVSVNKANIWNMIKSVYIPISQMGANIQGLQFCNTISNDDKIGFYDIETDSEENFLLGYVNTKKFEDPEKMVKYLSKFDIAVSFNGFRFDAEVLARYCRDYFYEIRNANFIAHSIKGVLNIDLLSIIKIIIGKESYGAEALAKELKFPEEIISHEFSDKDKKCMQDIRILEFLWKEYDIPIVFNTISSLCNIDTTLMQIVQKDRLRKWIFISKYLRNNLLPTRPEARQIKMSGEPVKLCKDGFYENMTYWDIKGAYNRTAINLGDLGIYENDNTFSELQRELYDLSQNPKLKPFMKSISNPLCGSQYSVNEHFRNEEIFNRIVKTVADKINKVIKNNKDCVFSNTDCLVLPSNNPKPDIEGYEVKEEHKFSELFLYSVNKWCGKTKDRIEFRGFKRLNSRNPKILQVAREEILSKLKKKEGEDFKEALEDYEKLVSKTVKDIKKFDKDYFKFVVRKKNDYCWDVSLMDIWKSLEVGFNEIFYEGYNKHTTNEKKINYQYYKELVLELAKEYQPDKE